MNTKLIARFGLLIAVALVLGYFERFIPIASGLPGVKLGLANTVLLYALYLMNVKNAFGLMLIKVLMSGLLFAGVNGMLYSFAGGLLSLSMMVLIKRLENVGIVGVSVIGAAFHNVGQLMVASMVVQTKGVIFYMPILLVSAIITGTLTGIISKYVFKGLSAASLHPSRLNSNEIGVTNEYLKKHSTKYL
ncbi:Gx transporter family protein [Alkaliphilus peptidifermentans]|uniref:Heptaprenyl diphosphate synthase n=1 Tax=Alkaliphilus peptidifermentans DSM 18978 TaxID=1120976 RepID=A0A1G5J1D2_9FIRM|nr:Gx transporter family protein [Alkaliphilus peptidifermentans]SCY82087.1 heptaprenyl diphosphate synthase [Alkaliphilus peptidifermentans DSM 18978]